MEKYYQSIIRALTKALEHEEESTKWYKGLYDIALKEIISLKKELDELKKGDALSDNL